MMKILEITFDIVRRQCQQFRIDWQGGLTKQKDLVMHCGGGVVAWVWGVVNDLMKHRCWRDLTRYSWDVTSCREQS